MERRAKILRLPEALHTRLVREAGERTAKIGQRVTVNQLIIEILEAHFRRQGRRTARR